MILPRPTSQRLIFKSATSFRDYGISDLVLHLVRDHGVLVCVVYGYRKLRIAWSKLTDEVQQTICRERSYATKVDNLEIAEGGEAAPDRIANTIPSNSEVHQVGKVLRKRNDVAIGEVIRNANKIELLQIVKTAERINQDLLVVP